LQGAGGGHGKLQILNQTIWGNDCTCTHFSQ
jgi:hypothetical protein